MNGFTRNLPWAGLGVLTLVGCAARPPLAVQSPQPLGSEVDQIMRQQEENAEPAKFIIYSHEFELNGTGHDGRERGLELNEFGEDHLRQIATSLKQGVEFPVVVERSQTSSRVGSKYQYPVHFDQELDQRRRQVVVANLEQLGVSVADRLVVVAPSYAEGLSGAEAARAYNRGFCSTGGGGGGGIGGGGGGGGGGFGGEAQ